MRYASIDIETTGLDIKICQMIEFGCVLDDMETPTKELPTFHTYILRDYYVGQPYALAMHSKIFKRIADREPGYNYFEPLEAFDKFEAWLQKNKMDWTGLNVVGKNVGAFDLQFMLKDWPHFRCRHRILDMGSAFYNPLYDFDKLPDLKTCKERVGMEDIVQHTALADAMDCVEILRRRYAGALEQLRNQALSQGKSNDPNAT